MLTSWSVRVSFVGCLLASLSFVSACADFGATVEGQKLPPRQTPQEETKTVVDAVQGSGEAPAELKGLLTQAADAVYTGTFGSGNPDVERVGGTAVCFRGGCLHHVIYRDTCVALTAKKAALEVPAARLQDWPGAIYKTPAVRLADGRLDVTWALLLSEPQNQRTQLEALLKPRGPERPAFRPEVCRAAGADTGVNPNAPASPSAAAAPLVNPNPPRAK